MMALKQQEKELKALEKARNGKKNRRGKKPKGYVWGDFRANEAKDRKSKESGLGPEWWSVPLWGEYKLEIPV
jgi:hypothetical protein